MFVVFPETSESGLKNHKHRIVRLTGFQVCKPTYLVHPARPPDGYLIGIERMMKRKMSRFRRRCMKLVNVEVCVDPLTGVEP